MADGLTATAQPASGRVLLRLEWAAVTLANIVRVHPDGTEHPVRNAEPGYVNTTWKNYDHEAPLDVAVSYKATSPTSGTVHTSAAVTVTSDGAAWLKHPGKPYLNRTVHIREDRVRRLPARRGVLRPIGRADPIVVHSTRSTDSGAVVLNIRTSGEAAELRELLADGAPLLLQTPAVWGGESLYVSVDTVEVGRLAQNGVLPNRRLLLPFDVIGRPPGTAGGAAGLTYDDLAATGKTYATITGTIDDLISAV